MRLIRTAAAGLVALACASCGSAPSPVPEPTAASPSPSQRFVGQPTEREGACTDQPWSAANPPFSGAGPHLIAPVPVRDDLADDIAVGHIPYDPPDLRGLPYSGDESVLTNPISTRLAEVQLLACIEPVRGDGPIAEVACDFTDPPGAKLTFPLYEASYRVTVREASTGRIVTTLTAPGTVDGTDNCPSVATDTGHTILLRSLTRDTLIDVLRPLAVANIPR